MGDHRTSIELALEASLPPSDSSSTSSSDDSTDGKAHGVDLDTLAVRSLLLRSSYGLAPAVPDTVIFDVVISWRLRAMALTKHAKCFILCTM